MSMLSTLLFSPPPPLPRVISVGETYGHIRRSNPDGNKFEHPANIAPCKNRRRTKKFSDLALKVFSAVQSGVKTINEICAETGFSRSTARNYLRRLEADGMVVANRARLPVIFNPAPKQRSDGMKK